jgi:hypothetical protein
MTMTLLAVKSDCLHVMAENLGEIVRARNLFRQNFWTAIGHYAPTCWFFPPVDIWGSGDSSAP